MRFFSFISTLVLVCGAAVSAAPGSKPNILFVLTDDQDILLGSSDYQPKIKKLLQEEGITITNQFVSTPVCCPSRGSFLTGKHIHNIPMKNNSLEGNCSGPAWNNGPEKETIGVKMKGLGYETFFSGKYLNQYGAPGAGGVEHVPPGWDKWVGLVGNSRYYNYTISNDGAKEVHGDNYATDYLTDVVKNHTINFIRSQANLGKPFFAMASVPACHSPHEPAPQYAFHFQPEKKVPRNPNYGTGWNEKHWLVENEGKIWEANPVRAQFSDWEHNRRLEVLLSVDDMVEELVGVLDTLNVLDNTYIFYTADHGYHLGQFGLMKDKRFPYEFDIRTPSYVRGPKLGKNIKTGLTMLNIDYLPTFIAIGNGEVDKSIDGRSVLADLEAATAAAERPTVEGRDFLVEYFGEHGAPAKGGACGAQWSEGMACWTEGNEKLQPGPFKGGLLCSCQDSINNTYACIRRVNGGSPRASSLDSSKLSSMNGLGENFLYCKFSGNPTFEEYYDIDEDPWQLKNAMDTLDVEQRDYLRQKLKKFVACSGTDSCR